MMSRSPNTDNPWRPFRCHSASRRVSNLGGHETRKRQTLAQNALHISSEHKRSNKHTGFQQTQNDIPVQDNVYNFDDNGNPSMPHAFLCSGLKSVTTCDKQTQTDLCEESSVTRDPGLQKAARKVSHSKSCDSFVRKCTFNPHASRSCEVANTVNKESMSFKQTIVSENNTSPSRAFEAANDTISSIFQAENSNTSIIKGQSETLDFNADKVNDFSSYINTADIDLGRNVDHETLSQIANDQESSDRPHDLDHETVEANTDQHFYVSVDSELQNMPCQRKSDGSYKNQWSPFHIDQDNIRMRLFYDYRQSDECSFVSERSCYSATSDDEWDSYEIIDWNQYTDDYKQEEMDKERRSDAYNTPPTTPTLDLSALDGYHTAPNSPKYPNSQTLSNSLESNSTEFCVIDSLTDYTNTNRESAAKYTNGVINYSDIDRDVTGHNIANNANKIHYDQSLCCRCGKATEHSQADETLKMAEKDLRANDRKVQFEYSRRNFRARERDPRILQLEIPPLISVNSIHYEADPETGKAKVIGCGSFGKVYKARFSDPMFYHLPIVIKEFNEEFTNSKEIIDEAKRLLYLQDTGYVPICHGLLCFGSSNDPKYGIVQEYVGTGLTLEQMLWDQYELPLEFWFRIVIQCCEGLARFHDKGILLNDIKTNNILLEFGEHTIRIRYIDFGLATDMRGKRYKNTKSLEDFVYLAPEVRQYGKITTVATDIYSLGFILEQINKYSGIHEFTVVARLCMDKDPGKRLPVRLAGKMIMEDMYKLGFDPLLSRDLYYHNQT